MIINLNKFKIMAKNGKTAAVKGRETKLNKKSNDELIQIILKKDKIERNLNNQIKSLKGEVNALSNCVKNFDSDMEGTYQTLESYKDQVKTLNEKNDALKIEANDNRSLYEEENKRAIMLNDKVNMWKVATCIMTAVAVISTIVTIL